MQTSKPITSEEGNKLGLVDAVVLPAKLIDVSRQWALDIAAFRKPLLRSLHRTDKLCALSEARNILKVARQQAMQTARNLPHHLVCIDVIEEGILHGGHSGVLEVYFFCVHFDMTNLLFLSASLLSNPTFHLLQSG